MASETALTNALRNAIKEQILPRLKTAPRTALDRAGLTANKVNHYNKKSGNIPRSEFLLAALIELSPAGIMVTDPGSELKWRISANPVREGIMEEPDAPSPLQLSLLALLEGANVGEPRILRKAPGVVELQLQLTRVPRAS